MWVYIRGGVYRGMWFYIWGGGQWDVVLYMGGVQRDVILYLGECTEGCGCIYGGGGGGCTEGYDSIYGGVHRGIWVYIERGII